MNRPRNFISRAAIARVSQNSPLHAFLQRRKEPLVPIAGNIDDIENRRRFIMVLAKALLTFGAPSHRIESQLAVASEVLGAEAEFVHIPAIVIVTIRNEALRTTRTHFIRSCGRIALSPLQDVHRVYRDVLHDRLSAEEGTHLLKAMLRASPMYSIGTRCIFAFICGAIICILAFGGTFFDLWISGLCATLLKYLGCNAANKSTVYANVYEISVSILVAFVARGLSSIPPGGWFCYSAVSSAGVVLILPGFTILMSALELMSRNIFCGSVRIVYAIIYTLFLGFGLTIGSDLYLVFDKNARRTFRQGALTDVYLHGAFSMINGTQPFRSIKGTLIHESITELSHVFKGCKRNPDWSTVFQPIPWWTIFILVPSYSLFSSLSNLQDFKRWPQLVIMVFFSCAAYTANKGVSIVLAGRVDISSAAGALMIGLLGNIYARIIRGTAFTAMVTGVLFLVPSGIAQGGGLSQTYKSSAEQYSSGFALALRMISVASGVTVGLFVSQVVVYFFGARKGGAGAHFAF